MLYSHSTYHDTVFCNEFSKSTLSIILTVASFASAVCIATFS